jgi:tRNA (adenine57-N1/adenine58-N1)-methyltransferase catalytic subunit
VNEIDSSIIASMLDVYPGCRVVESGTGSGCMTISLARAVYPTGHIYTFEYNSVRAEKAREEFAK